MTTLYVLYESANGYALFERTQSEEIGSKLEEVQAAVLDVTRFRRTVSLKAFLPFQSAELALENANAISEGVMHENLKDFLEMNLPKVKDIAKAKYRVGVTDPKIGSAIQDVLNIPCESNEMVLELLRGVRLHLYKFISALKDGDLERAQLGLGHSYSRSKVKFNVNKSDNMIIQSIALLDQMDKDLNTFAMRMREWYSWHFPELGRIVNDNYMFARVAKFIRVRSSLTEESLPELEAIVMDADLARQVYDASRASMGTDLSEVDMIHIEQFADRVVHLNEYRQKLHTYLTSKMDLVAPNLAALTGEQIAARLISHAGSLVNLAKAPASTVQIYGAEKALFRALKTKGKTPKYGLIYNTSFIVKANPKNKGRLSRYLANKCSMASRLDLFNDVPSKTFGEKLREQVEERVLFYSSGTVPRKNVDVMHDAAEEYKEVVQKSREEEAARLEKEERKRKRKAKKSKQEAEENGASSSAPMEEEAAPAEEVPKKKKKSKKSKSEDAE